MTTPRPSTALAEWADRHPDAAADLADALGLAVVGQSEDAETVTLSRHEYDALRTLARKALDEGAAA